MPEILVKEYRGSVLENIYRGYMCIVDDSRKVVSKIGGIDQLFYYRSSAKPLQALPIIMNGLNVKYSLNGDEITICAGSHAGEPIHLNVLESLLRKTGFLESDLIMKPKYPDAYDYKSLMEPRKLFHCCAGKHIGLMMLSHELGEDIKNYWRTDSKANTIILSIISYMANLPVESIKLGIDGCGVPVFACGLKNIAISYLHLACPDLIEDDKLANSVSELTALINDHYLMMRGTNFPCSILNQDKNIIAKGGAKGIYCLGLKKERLGIAFKLEDGSEHTWPLIIAGILEKLGYDNYQTIENMYKLQSLTLLNDNNSVVGNYKVVFNI